MRDIVRRRPRWALLATGLGVSSLALIQIQYGFAPAGDWIVSRWGLWWGVVGAVLSLGWLAASVGAYRLIEGQASVAGWLESERRESFASGLSGALVASLLLVSLEELLLRDVVLFQIGPLAAVIAAGLWRLHGGRRATLWGMAHSLLLTGIALISGNLLAAWGAHVLTDWAWLGYLAVASWRRMPVAQRAVGTGSL